jgi:hypothetical protein
MWYRFWCVADSLSRGRAKTRLCRRLRTVQTRPLWMPSELACVVRWSRSPVRSRATALADAHQPDISVEQTASVPPTAFALPQSFNADAANFTRKLSAAVRHTNRYVPASPFREPSASASLQRPRSMTLRRQVGCDRSSLHHKVRALRWCCLSGVWTLLGSAGLCRSRRDLGRTRVTADVVDLLIKNGADITQKDIAGYTALHWAVIRKQLEPVQMFLSVRRLRVCLLPARLAVAARAVLCSTSERWPADALAIHQRRCARGA